MPVVQIPVTIQCFTKLLPSFLLSGCTWLYKLCNCSRYYKHSATYENLRIFYHHSCDCRVGGVSQLTERSTVNNCETQRRDYMLLSFHEGVHRWGEGAESLSVQGRNITRLNVFKYRMMVKIFVKHEILNTSK